jgi:hypothetical protein
MIDRSLKKAPATRLNERPEELLELLDPGEQIVLREYIESFVPAVSDRHPLLRANSATALKIAGFHRKEIDHHEHKGLKTNSLNNLSQTNSTSNLPESAGFPMRQVCSCGDLPMPDSAGTASLEDNFKPSRTNTCITHIEFSPMPTLPDPAGMFPGPDRSIDLETLQASRAVACRYRSRRIGEFLKELDLTEGRSTGIPKILQAMAANGSDLPIFETDPDRTSFLVRLPVRSKPEESGSELGLSRDQVGTKSAGQKAEAQDEAQDGESRPESQPESRPELGVESGAQSGPSRDPVTRSKCEGP